MSLQTLETPKPTKLPPTDRRLLEDGISVKFKLAGTQDFNSPFSSPGNSNPYVIGVGPRSLEQWNLQKSGLLEGPDGDGGDYTEEGHRRKEQERERQFTQTIMELRYNQLLNDLDEQIAQTKIDLSEMRRSLAEIEAQRAELAPLIAVQRQVVAAAGQANIRQERVTARQEEVTQEQGAKVAALVAQRPEKEQAVETANQNAQVAKAELQASTTEAKVAEAKHEEAKTEASLSLSDVKTLESALLKDAEGNMVFKKTSPGGAVEFVDSEGKKISDQALEALRQEKGSALETAAREYDPEEVKKIWDIRRAANISYDGMEMTGMVKDARQEDVQKAQVKWEKAGEALTYARGELKTLNENIATETEKLKVEQAKLAEERAKLEETRKTLANEKEKLAELEKKDQELAKQQADLKASIDSNEKKLEGFESARKKMTDPDYARKIQNREISYEQMVQDLPDSMRGSFMAQYPAPKQQATLLPDSNPAAERFVSTPSTPSTLVGSKAQTGITAASSLGDGPASLKDNDKLQVAFSQAAPNTKPAEPASTPAAPNLEDDKKVANKVSAAPALAIA